LDQDGFSGGIGGDGVKFFEDEVEGGEDFFVLGESGGIVEGVVFSVGSDFLFSVIEDFELFSFGGNVVI